MFMNAIKNLRGLSGSICPKRCDAGLHLRSSQVVLMLQHNLTFLINILYRLVTLPHLIESLSSLP